jgi:hypothetical protein
MRAHDHVGAVEHVRTLQVGLGRRARDLLGGGAVHRHRAGRLGAGKEFRQRHRDREAHGTLGTVLVTVKVAAGAAQRVVLDDHAQIRPGRALGVVGHERGGEAGHTGVHREAVRPQVVGDDFHGALLVEPHLGVARDVVRHREQLLGHQGLDARQHGVAPGVGFGEPGHERRQPERRLEAVHPANHGRGGGALGRGLLSSDGTNGDGH